MKYKIYKYEISNNEGKALHPDKHHIIFENSKGPDNYGSYATYRGKSNAVIMNIRPMSSDTIGLIGKHSTEREITIYDNEQDVAGVQYVSDNDYPHAVFIAMPRLNTIAIADGSKISADSAVGRLHSVIAHRQNMFFTAEVIKEAYDLGKAVQKFRVFEVDFAVGPVNPHSGDLGLELDDDRKKDHIRKILGKAKAADNDKLKLEGGFLTAVHELQQSGHASIGFKAENEDGTLIHAPKPNDKLIRAYDLDDEQTGPDVDIKIDFPGLKAQFPLTQAHITSVRKVARQLLKKDENE